MRHPTTLLSAIFLLTLSTTTYAAPAPAPADAIANNAVLVDRAPVPDPVADAAPAAGGTHGPIANQKRDPEPVITARAPEPAPTNKENGDKTKEDTKTKAHDVRAAGPEPAPTDKKENDHNTKEGDTKSKPHDVRAAGPAPAEATGPGKRDAAPEPGSTGPGKRDAAPEPNSTGNGKRDAAPEPEQTGNGRRDAGITARAAAPMPEVTNGPHKREAAPAPGSTNGP